MKTYELTVIELRSLLAEAYARGFSEPRGEPYSLAVATELTARLDDELRASQGRPLSGIGGEFQRTIESGVWDVEEQAPKDQDR